MFQSQRTLSILELLKRSITRTATYKMSSQPSSILILGGEVVNDDRMFRSDVYIENGIIKQLGVGLSPSTPDTTIIDATGKFVIPGGIDTHTHFQMRFMGADSVETFYSGTRAALAGGTTMHIDFAQDPTSTLLEAYDLWRKRADGNSCCDYGLHVIIPKWDKQARSDMEILTKEKGVNSFKVFMAYKGALMLKDDELLEVFEACQKLGALAMVHAENGDAIHLNQKKIKEMGITGPEGHLYSRPEELETEATHRAIVLADQVNCPLYVVHVMAKTAADIVEAKRKEGCIVFGEPIAAGLGTDGTNYFNSCWRHAACHVLSPPLRPDPTTPGYLMDKLAKGDLECTGTDHCVFSTSQKALGAQDFSLIPNGINGVQERLTVIWEKGVMSGKLSPSQFVAVTSSNAAKVFNVYPKKGRIDIGSDADVVVWDPHKKQTISASTHCSMVDFNIFEGMECRGYPLYVITRGNIAVYNGKLQETRGWGKFVPTPPFCKYVYEPTYLRTLSRMPKKIEREPYMGV